MIIINILFSACLAQLSSSNEQNQPTEILQGISEAESDVESYMVFDGRINYSIVNFDGNVIVRKRLFGFLDSIPKDSIDIRNLKEIGSSFLIFTGKCKSGNFFYKRSSNFNDYSYDLDEDYFIYYGNSPVTLNKVEALPAHIQKIFEQKKAELADVRFSDQ